MLIIGHRGAKGLAPENTIASFQAALDAGVDGIEFDVRTTKDNVPVIFHDRAIGVRKIARTTFKSLKSKQPDLLTLDELLRFIKNRVRIVIEIKPGAATEPIVQCLEDRIRNGLDLQKVSVSSFDIKVLREMKQSLPELTLVVNEAWSGIRATRRARTIGTKYITMNQKWLWGGFIRSLVAKGFVLTAYTLNDPKKAEKWRTLGIYAAVTDYPDRF